MTTTTTLSVTHDGYRATALVERGNRAANLAEVVAAAKQSDADLAADYRAILAEIAHELYLVIDRDYDGSRDAGCCWYTVSLRHRRIEGDTLAKSIRLTATEFRGWTPSAEEVEAERIRILRAATAIGLGRANYWYGPHRTVAAAAA